MRISHKYKIVFLSNRKCGSKSVRLYLDDVSEIKSNSDYPFNNHGCAKGLKKHFDSVGWSWSDYCHLTTIRNPYDRVVSIYFFAKEYQGNIWHPLYKQAPTFQEFVARLPDYIKETVHSLDGERYLKTGQKWISIDEFAFDDDGKQLIEHILPIETISESLPPIMLERGLSLQDDIPKINQTKHDNYRQYYTEKEKRIVQSIFEADFEYGKYTF